MVGLVGLSCSRFICARMCGGWACMDPALLPCSDGTALRFMLHGMHEALPTSHWPLKFTQSRRLAPCRYVTMSCRL